MELSIIGGGNLGQAIADGLLSTGYLRPGELTITRRRPEKLSRFADMGVTVTADNVEAVADADMVILAVKPYQVLEVVAAIKDTLKPDTILVSVVSGIELDQLSEAVGQKCPVVRAMPNTAIAIRQSMTCVAAKSSHAAASDQVRDLFSNLGEAVVIDEALMDAATVLGACGIAYALRFIRAATQGGIEIGFDANTAALIAGQTAKGAASLLLEHGMHPEAEIDKVTTPKGCTIVGLNEMEHQGFSSSLIRGILASFNKLQ